MNKYANIRKLLTAARILLSSLQEKWLNSAKEREQLADRAFELVLIAYGDKAGNIGDSKDLLANSSGWFGIFDGDQLVGFQAYKKTPFGLKGFAVGHDGSSAAKKALIKAKIKHLNEEGHYAEVSGDVERVLTGKVPFVCNQFAEEILGKKVQLEDDGVHYTRNIAGVGSHTKVIVGKPKGVGTVTGPNECEVEEKAADVELTDDDREEMLAHGMCDVDLWSEDDDE